MNDMLLLLSAAEIRTCLQKMHVRIFKNRELGHCELHFS